MAECSGAEFINYTETIAGYGDTRDLALNALLEKLKGHENDVKCAGKCLNGVCRAFLIPPDTVKYRVYWRKSTGMIRWKCTWGPGLLEFECGCGVESED